jgi:uncharacterized protein HemY
MNQDRIQQLENLVKQNPQSALMHYTLGIEYLRNGKKRKAINILKKTIAIDGEYSAAYRELGKALVESNMKPEAAIIFNKGIAVAEERGDIQTAREMRVFLKRISK